MLRLLPGILFLSCGSGAVAGVLEDYVALQTGSFTSEVQARHDARYDESTWHIVEIWSGGADVRWLYVESWMQGADAPYLQRVAKLTIAADGSILSRRYRIKEATRVLGAWRDADRFAAITPADLIELDGCATTIVRAGRDRFEGGTTGARCRNAYKGAAYAVSRSVLTRDGMLNWDRGFSADGELIWGPAAGGYRFLRVGAGDSCVDPVRMLVYGTISDREKFGDYGNALMRSGLYERVNGYYEAITPAVEVFEGEPPPERGVLVARFPCLEKAREFWYSDEYSEIRKLRDGIAEFEILVLRVPPLPAHLR